LRIFYDTEFIEDGRTIDLISIGMVAEDGRELYLVAGDGRAVCRAVENDWLREHVVPSLPALLTGEPYPRFWKWDRDHPDYLAVNRRDTIAASVRDFILATPDPQLWAWYAAYDHVALCQLWGRMIDLPKGIPMWTNDLKQECDRLGNPQMPEQESGEHNALADARHVKVMAEYLAARPVGR
jgi:3' exoribonuclease, RNase T-like